MKNKTLFIPLALFMVLALFFAKQLLRNQNGEDPTNLESVLVGKPVPSFVLPDLFDTDKTYDNALFEHHKPLLLNVWATWCPTCYAEHQFLNTLSQQGVKIIGLNYKDHRDKAIKWVNDLGDPYQHILYDPKGRFGLDLGVYGAPETFLIDAKGVIRYRHIGDVNERNWNEKLLPMYNKLLEEAKP